jgi:hypothetical protein
MRARIAFAAALGLALTLTAVGGASADPPVDPRFPTLNGHTVCGVFSQPLYDAEQAQIATAQTAGAYKGLYDRFAVDPTADSFSVSSEYNQWQQALAAYQRAKLAVADIYAGQNAALCGR